MSERNRSNSDNRGELESLSEWVQRRQDKSKKFWNSNKFVIGVIIITVLAIAGWVFYNMYKNKKKKKKKKKAKPINLIGQNSFSSPSLDQASLEQLLGELDDDQYQQLVASLK